VLAGPDAPHHRHAALHAPQAPRIERRIGGAVVLDARADADAEHDAAAGEHVERRDLLGEQDGAVMQRQDDDGEGDLHPLGRRGGDRERHHDLGIGKGDRSPAAIVLYGPASIRRHHSSTVPRSRPGTITGRFIPICMALLVSQNAARSDHCSPAANAGSVGARVSRPARRAARAGARLRCDVNAARRRSLRLKRSAGATVRL
jgi:hypothetical protein